MIPYLPMYPMLPWYRESFLRKGIRIATVATTEPITLEVAQQHLRLDLYGSPLSHPDDGLLQDIYIPAAREHCESLSGRSLALQEYEVAMRVFPPAYCDESAVELPLGPVRSITTVTYLDSDGVSQTLAPDSYSVDLFSEKGRLYPAPGTSWPTGIQEVPNAIRIKFYAGYGELPGSPTDDSPMPKKYKAAILLVLNHLYENRSATEPQNQLPQQIELGVKALLLPSSLRNGFGTPC